MRTSTSSLWATCFLLSAAMSAAGSPPEGETRQGPLYLKSADQTSLVWISASDAVIDGKVRLDEFDAYAKQMLSLDLDMVRPGWEEESKLPEKSEAANRGECTTWITSPSSSLNQSLEEIAEHSRVVLTGTIRSQDQGFFRGRASSLFEVEVDDVLKAPNKASFEPRVFFIYSTARIPLGKSVLCRRSSHYPAAPAVGKRVLIFADVVLETERPVLVPNEQTLAFENADGTAVFPGSSRNLLDPPDWGFMARKIEELKRALEVDEGTAERVKGGAR